MQALGKTASLLVLLSEEERTNFPQLTANVLYCTGKIGAMSLPKVIAAIETAVKREALIDETLYRETHALYHAILEALQGVTRGNLAVGEVMRTVGLRFAVVRGKLFSDPEEGEWLTVALYGTIGAPIRGEEHEVIGLGINHI